MEEREKKWMLCNGRERERQGIMEEREKYSKSREFYFEVGPSNDNKIELNYNSNFSKQAKRCIWIRYGIHPEFELVFQNWFKFSVPNKTFFCVGPGDFGFKSQNHNLNLVYQTAPNAHPIFLSLTEHWKTFHSLSFFFSPCFLVNLIYFYSKSFIDFQHVYFIL